LRDSARNSSHRTTDKPEIALLSLEENEKELKTLVTIGRGGTGKTSFVAMMAKYFIEAEDSPLLLVDADPDQNLGEMVGVDMNEAGKKTISDLLVETFLEEGGTTIGVAPTERVENRIWAKGMYEGGNFDFIALGTKWVEGCYCLPNAALKGALGSLTKTYRYVLIDSPAGLEHLNRRIATRVNDIFDVIDPSKKSLDHVERAHRVAEEVKIDFENFYVVGGYRLQENLRDQIEDRFKFKYLGKIARDEKVEEYVVEGRSLLDLPSDYPAFNSVKAILKSAGYGDA
jgi:CO dehydrogenase maturation factor